MWRSINSALVGARGGWQTTAFLAGTLIAGFQQAAAPLGWTRVTTNDDSIIRINGSTTPGTGGTNGFTSTFNTQTQTGSQSISSATTASTSTGTGTSGSTTITTSTMPSHTHTIRINTNCLQTNYLHTPGQAGSGDTTTSTGSDGSHNHSVPALSIPSLGVNSFTAGPLSITTGIKYVDILIAKKN